MFAAESCVSRSIAALTLHMQRSIGQAAQALRARTAEGRLRPQVFGAEA